jgi:hypothetical protein
VGKPLASRCLGEVPTARRRRGEKREEGEGAEAFGPVGCPNGAAGKKV